MNIELTGSSTIRLSDPDSSWYSIEVPPTLAGMLVIHSILVARQMSGSRLGTPAAPTQFQINSMVAAFSARKERETDEALSRIADTEVDL